MACNKDNEKARVSKVSEETILKISKEISVKFIEMGRITPTNFNENFTNIYSTIKNTVDYD